MVTVEKTYLFWCFSLGTTACVPHIWKKPDNGKCPENEILQFSCENNQTFRVFKKDSLSL